MAGVPVAKWRALMTRPLRSLVVFLLFLASVTVAHAQSGMWGSRGVSRRFVLRDPMLYVADGRGVAVYNTSDPAAITRADVEISDAETRDLALSGNDLLVVAGADGIQRFRVGSGGALDRLSTVAEEGGTLRIAANATRVASGGAKILTMYRREGTDLTLAWELRYDFKVLALAFVGNYLYASIERQGVRVYDVANGREVNTLILDAHGFSLSGSVLWAAVGGSGIFSVDVSDPVNPRILGNAGGGEVNMTDVAVAGTRAFAIQPPDKVYTFDVSSPAEPILVGSRSEPAHVLAAGGTRVFLAGSQFDVYGLTRETGVPVRVYDARNFASLVLLGEAHDLAGPVSGVATDGSLAYVVDPPYLRILDISKTAEPRELSSIVIPEIQDRIRVRNGLAVIYGRGDVNFADVSDPYHPKYLGIYRSTGTPPSNAGILRDTFVEANYASGLHIVDYSVPSNPLQIAGRIWHYLDLVSSDDAVYAILQNELLTLDLTNRHKVVDRQTRAYDSLQVETVPPNSAQPDLLVLRETQDFRIFSLADPFAPAEVATVETKRPGLMGTNGGNIYYEKDGLLWRIDAFDPTVPLETHLHATSAMQISGAGEKLVVADRYSVRIYGPDTEPPPPPPPPQQPPKRRSARK
ncbi:MAG: hypothetical protein QOH21_2493 [Acidobacteriota bacterium]|jgi:hypothetical protein|nr:hypothetical protein [Acidobacteriota bacterium]